MLEKSYTIVLSRALSYLDMFMLYIFCVNGDNLVF